MQLASKLCQLHSHFVTTHFSGCLLTNKYIQSWGKIQIKVRSLQINITYRSKLSKIPKLYI